MKQLLLALSLGLSTAAMGQTLAEQTARAAQAAQAAQTAQTAQTLHACSPADIPAGYVAVSVSPACPGNSNPLSFNAIRVDTMPPGAVLKACGIPSQLLPSGWATLGWGPMVSSNGTYAAYARTIENLNGLPPGTQVSICPGLFVPTGWTVLSRGGAPCGTIGSTTFRASLIQKN